MLIKTFVVWMLIAVGEVINGNIRVRYLHKRFGHHRAKHISFFLGLSIFYAIAWFFLPWIEPQDINDCFVIGFIWVFLMILLDVYFGRAVFHYTWTKILDDFNPLKGNWLGVGMILLFLCPTIIFLIR
jgi:hypothetical protein